MTREEILANLNVETLIAIGVDIDSVPDYILYNMTQPWEQLSKEEQEEVLQVIRNTGNVIN